MLQTLVEAMQTIPKEDQNSSWVMDIKSIVTEFMASLCFAYQKYKLNDNSGFVSKLLGYAKRIIFLSQDIQSNTESNQRNLGFLFLRVLVEGQCCDI